MKFRNKVTGVVWIIDDPERQERLSKDEEYELVEEKKAAKTEPKAESVKVTETAKPKAKSKK